MTGGVPPGGALIDVYDLLLFDLDGVVYVGERAVPAAADVLTELHRRDAAICYVTNNASRRAETVAALLGRLGVPADAREVLTSAQAAAELMGVRLAVGAPVLTIGSEALADEVRAVGLDVVSAAVDKPVAVVQGYGPEVGWRHLAEAALAVTAGAWWVATNTDRTLPSPDGPLPGNGALVAAVSVATGKQPDVVVGKPSPQLFEAAVRRYAARRPLVIGDRLDTDIEGAVRAGHDSVLVLTGVAHPADAWRAPQTCRPTYLADDLGDLLREYPEVTVESGAARCREWTVAREGSAWSLAGHGTALDALRTLCAARWSTPEATPDEVQARDAAAADAVRELALARR
ncbi:MAG: HAD-IIA family hydrolase [Micromonosporaceae bacterium]